MLLPSKIKWVNIFHVILKCLRFNTMWYILYVILGINCEFITSVILPGTTLPITQTVSDWGSGGSVGGFKVSLRYFDRTSDWPSSIFRQAKPYFHWHGLTLLGHSRSKVTSGSQERYLSKACHYMTQSLYTVHIYDHPSFHFFLLPLSSKSGWQRKVHMTVYVHMT